MSGLQVPQGPKQPNVTPIYGGLHPTGGEPGGRTDGLNVHATVAEAVWEGGLGGEPKARQQDMVL
jgi:hypothetical protein